MPNDAVEHDEKTIRLENLRRLMAGRGWKPADLQKRAGYGRYTYWRDLLEGEGKSFGERAARKLEDALGLPRKSLDSPYNPQAGGVAHVMTLDPVDDLASIKWGDVMQGVPLPPLFKCAVPDDALSPRTLKGVAFTFDTRAQAAPGVVVLVEDSAGVRYMRRYAQGAAGQWAAEAANGYATLNSSRDGLKLLAVAVSRWDGTG